MIEDLSGAVAAALAVIAYIEVRVTQRVNNALLELEASRRDRRADSHEGEGHVPGTGPH